MKEKWKDIKDYEGIYIVSNTGRVKSLDRLETLKSGCVRFRKGLNINIRPKVGYLSVNLSKNGINKHYLLHRIIAQAFIPNLENKPHIDHINTIKTDNRIENLRWVTPKENARNSITRTRYRKPNFGKTLAKNHLAIKIDQYNLSMEFIKTFGCIKEAAIELNCSSSNITDCLKGRIKKTHNFIFKYNE